MVSPTPTPVLRPRPSYVREATIYLPAPRGVADRRIRLGMDRPSNSDEGWWTTLAWAHDGDRVVSCLEVGPPLGPPPESPLARMGPAFAGALAGLVAEIGGRQALRLRLPEAADPARPWDRPLVLQIAIAWEPVRAATLQANQLARAALAAFGRAIEAAGRPS